jgi:CRP/FNR family transcriptional regulator, cyclic AMP receptor protein
MNSASTTAQSSATLESYRILENVIFLKKAPLFAPVDTSDLKAVALIAEELRFEAGQEIVHDGDVGDSMYIIKDGTVAITKNAESGSAIELAVLSKGDCFGDMAVLDAEVRSASAIARAGCLLLCIKRDDLLDVMLDSPSIAIGLLKTFVKRLRKANSAIETLSRKAPVVSAGEQKGAKG